MNGELERKIHEIHSTCTELRAEQVEQGKGIATLVERTDQQEKRMDRMDRKAKQAGGGAGAIGGVIAGFLAQLLGFGSGN